MENQYNPGNNPGGSQQVDLPNATIIMVLGIGSLVGLLCSGLPGLIMAIIALVLARGDNRLYLANPAYYTTNSAGNVRTGRICALISIWICVIAIILIIFLLVALGVGFFRGMFNNLY